MKKMRRTMMKAPSDFQGTLGDLLDGWAQHVLLDPPAVERFHKKLCGYLQSADPLFLVRQAGKQRRGETLRTKSGHQLRPTDNAPAWWIHREILFDHFGADHVFSEFIENVPCHFHDVQRRAPDNVCNAGWHVAHIFNTKDGDTDWQRWDKRELARRFVRSVHPCNYFPIPKGRQREWQQYGGDPAVIGFFCNEFQSRYRSVWDDFLRLVGERPYPLLPNAREYSLFYGLGRGSSGNQGRSSRTLRPPENPVDEMYPPPAESPQPLLVKECKWRDNYGWKPYQNPADLDCLEAVPGSRIEFHLKRYDRTKFILSMTSDQWKRALGPYLNGRWRENGYSVSLTRTQDGQPIEEFVPRWAQHIRPADAQGNPTTSEG